MTEKVWLNSINPSQLLRYLVSRTSDRKLRLFAATCCNRIPFTSAKVEVVLVAELMADDLALSDEIDRASELARRELAEAKAFSREIDGLGEPEIGRAEALGAILEKPKWYHFRSHFAIRIADLCNEYAWDRDEQMLQTAAVRDIFGNPFRPITLDPRWQTANVLDLARTIYEEKAFERMPILADALMDARCSDEAILSHCRQDGEHVRGCWVVDLVLGRE